MKRVLTPVDQELTTKILWCLAGLLVLAIYSSMFLPIFPNSAGQLGTDWGLNVFPKWLATAYWFETNGFFSIPHFTPAICGGVPLLADPQSMVYSLPQLYFYFFDGIIAIHLTVMTFAALGYFGMYLLLRNRFDCCRAAAFFGSVIFLFNSFFIERMAIGHATFHSFMLVPLIAYTCLSRSLRLAAAGGGLLFAYMVLSGGAVIVPVAAAAVFALGLLRCLKLHSLKLRCQREDSIKRFFGAFIMAALAGIAIAAVKLVPALAYMAEFPRDGYLLPGFPGLRETAQTAFTLLFFDSSLTEAMASLVNVQWLLGTHEFQYGVSPVPLLIILVATVPWVSHYARSRTLPSLDPATTGIAALFLVTLAIPLVLNMYGPTWNAFLKTIPFIKNSTTQLRWFALYIPIIAVTAAIALNGLKARSSIKTTITGLAVLAILVFNILDIDDYPIAQPYNPSDILAANAALQAGGSVPKIREITMYTNQQDRAGGVVERNGDLAHGGSQLICSEPLFGYQLEFFRLGPLTPGAITQVTGGYLNIKNPACYLYPAENSCQPGDHFTEDQIEEAKQFASYKPFQWKQPIRQRIAGYLSLISLVACLCILILSIKGLVTKTGE
ncbi:MAG: hypothetical protein ABGY96_04380 [bacterium]|nr:hypothetical protein [Gammaproteobacteria bacterium]